MTHFAFLGTSGAIPSAGRDTTSLVLVADGAAALIDCGGSPVQKLKLAGVDPLALAYVLITHIHPDHAYGLPALVQNLFLFERRAELHVLCRPEHVGPLRTLLELFGLWERPGMFPVVLRPIGLGERAPAVDLGPLRVSTSPVEHGTMPNFAVRVDVRAEARPRGEASGEMAGAVRAEARPRGEASGEMAGAVRAEARPRGEASGEMAGAVRAEARPRGEASGEMIEKRSVVYSSDTQPCDAVVALARGADTLIHEATFPDRHRGRFGVHSTAGEAGAVAARAGVRRLILAHVEADYHDELDAMAHEARKRFGGVVEIAQELVPYPL